MTGTASNGGYWREGMRVRVGRGMTIWRIVGFMGERGSLANLERVDRVDVHTTVNTDRLNVE